MIHGHATMEWTLGASHSIVRNEASRWSSRASKLSKTRFPKAFSRSSSHKCSTGLSSGEYGGNETKRMFLGTFKADDLCQPAPSNIITILSSGCRDDISSRNICMHTLLTCGMIKVSSAPSVTDTAAYA